MSPTLPMLVALAMALSHVTTTQVRLGDLLTSENPIRINDVLTLSGGVLPRLLSGDSADLVVGDVESVDLRPLQNLVDKAKARASEVPGMAWRDFDSALTTYGLVEERAAKKLGLTQPQMIARSMQLWGHNLSEERDRRAGPDASAQRRGQITRTLLFELQDTPHGDD